MFQEYPKWVDIPGHEDGGKVVFSREEEESLKKRKPGRPKKADTWQSQTTPS